jgi:hypothetical protein
VREALAANIALFRHYFCIWPTWWWLFRRCEEICTVTTDENGRFDTSHWELCGEELDLYFWVDYNIDGAWTTVYRPPVPCNVHWNYPCGSDVTIRITDPRVAVIRSDPDLSGMQVTLLSIGNSYSPGQIHGASAGTQEGLTIVDGRPFGGSLEPNVAFSSDALINSKIHYYRWSYRRLTTGDGSTPALGDWTHISTPVYRHYQVVDQNGRLSFPTELLGPDPDHPGQNLFHIPRASRPDGNPYVIVDGRSDTASAFF